MKLNIARHIEQCRPYHNLFQLSFIINAEPHITEEWCILHLINITYNLYWSSIIRYDVVISLSAITKQYDTEPCGAVE